MRRYTGLFVVVGILAVSLGGALAVRHVVATDKDEVVVVHWSNSHPMRDGLMPAMAEEFNDDDFETSDGRPIRVEVVSCESRSQADDLVDRIEGVQRRSGGCTVDEAPAPRPTIVTPQSSDWLVDVNHRAGRTVVDPDTTEHIAETYLGIVTYREMAECLGWPDRQLGYADIVALRADAAGWTAYPDCARTEWGRTPLLAFTNPSRSTSGRNVLVSMYSMAADKAPADLTLADVERPEVVEEVEAFSELVDHYMPTTLSLNTKIAQGQGYGHFFLLPEDNLVSLYLGNEDAIGTDGAREDFTGVPDLVMLYPSEGAVLNANPAGIVNAPWVTPDRVEGAERWIEFLREDDQQQRFMEHGFRPASGTGLEPDAEQFDAWGLDVDQPTATLEPGELQPDVLEHIIDSWGAVKRPAIVTFVVDVSGSMDGAPLESVKAGMANLLDEMSDTNDPDNESQVGLVTFAESIVEEMAPAGISTARFDIGAAVARMEARGGTALYDAIARGIDLTNQVDGDDRSTRAVVVLSDGEAMDGMCLDQLVEMMSSAAESTISEFCGHDGDVARDDDGVAVDPADLTGVGLREPYGDDVQVFFVGFGTADVNIGRVLAQATDAEYQGQTEDDLANVVENLSGYF